MEKKRKKWVSLNSELPTEIPGPASFSTPTDRGVEGKYFSWLINRGKKVWWYEVRERERETSLTQTIEPFSPFLSRYFCTRQNDIKLQVQKNKISTQGQFHARNSSNFSLSFFRYFCRFYFRGPLSNFLPPLTNSFQSRVCCANPSFGGKNDFAGREKMAVSANIAEFRFSSVVMSAAEVSFFAKQTLGVQFSLPITFSHLWREKKRSVGYWCLHGCGNEIRSERESPLFLRSYKTNNICGEKWERAGPEAMHTDRP